MATAGVVACGVRRSPLVAAIWGPCAMPSVVVVG